MAGLQKKIWTPKAGNLKKQVRWIEKEVHRIGENHLVALATIAAEVRKSAYQPYSKYSVGAAIFTASGRIFASCNAETVSYTESDHAERSAVTKAISEGEIRLNGRKFIRAIAVSHPAHSGPCGGCRQRIAEHCDNCLILDVDNKGNIDRITTLVTLLPYAFTPSDLGIR